MMIYKQASNITGGNAAIFAYFMPGLMTGPADRDVFAVALQISPKFEDGDSFLMLLPPLLAVPVSRGFLLNI